MNEIICSTTSSGNCCFIIVTHGKNIESKGKIEKNLYSMCWFSRKFSKKDYRKKIKNKTNGYLERMLEELKIKKNRSCCFANLYIGIFVGSIASTLINPINFVGTVPTASISTVAAFDSLNEVAELSAKIEIIEEIQRKKKSKIKN